MTAKLFLLWLLFAGLVNALLGSWLRKWVPDDWQREVGRAVIGVTVAAVLGGLGTAAWWFWPYAKKEVSSANTPQPISDPVLDLAIGEPFGNLTLITLKNSGVETVGPVAVYLRCIWTRSDGQPFMSFDGFPSLDDQHSWWRIPELRSGAATNRDAIDVATKFIRDKNLMTQWQFSSAGLFVVDVVYQRESDHRRFSFSGIADLMEENSTKRPVFVPREMSDETKRLIDIMKAPSYRTGG